MKQALFVLLLFLTVFSTAAAESLTANGGTVIDFTALPYQSAAAPSTVYFISDISPEAMMEAYAALGVTLEGKVGQTAAVALSIGYYTGVGYPVTNTSTTVRPAFWLYM